MKMHSNQKLAFTPMLLTLLLALGAGYAFGYQSVYNNLQDTRASLLDQRNHLLNVQASLQRQLNVVQGYLTDNDRALSDVDAAMRTASR